MQDTHMTKTTDPSHIEDLHDLIKQIVELRNTIDRINQEIQQAQQMVNAFEAQRTELIAQMSHARDVLDHCLITGADPTVVKLTKTHKEIKSEKQKKMLVESTFTTYYDDAYQNINRTSF
jgi:uncharacterized coiled-coil DUF342 family protein